jgi:hypothetical protein
LQLQHDKVDAVFVLQPMLILERGRPGMPPIEKKLFEFNVSSYLPNYEAFMKQAVPFVRELERSTVEAQGATFLDATPVFRAARGQVFTDYAHLTPEANRFLASLIADHIDCRISTHLKPALIASTVAVQHRSSSSKATLDPCTSRVSGSAQ